MDHTPQPASTDDHKPSDLVTLNVGGSLYTTTVSTLTRYPDSMLGSMFGGNIPTYRDNNGHYIIDGDGPIFRHVLNFLRRSSLCLPHDFKEWDLLSAEADFFQIKELIDGVESLKDERSAGEGSRQEMEFTELSFVDNGELMYRGTGVTLRTIPTLWQFFESHANKNANIADRVDVTGTIVAKQGVRGVDRMKVYQEMTRLGFRLLDSSVWENKHVEIKLFGRNAIGNK